MMKLNRAPGVPRDRPRDHRLSSAPPRERAASRSRPPSRAHLLSSAHAPRARPLSSAPPLQCAASLSLARRTQTLTALAGSGLPAWLIIAFVGICRSVACGSRGQSHQLENTLVSGSLVSARARAALLRPPMPHPPDPRCHTLLCDRTPLRAHAQHLRT